jgi:catechol 2,3-dioxygenase-like lactoylglutathione lyase family enzyme
MSDAERRTAMIPQVILSLVLAFARWIWLQAPCDGKPAIVGNGTHVGFFAATKAQVDAFYATAVAAGASPDGEPGGREEYGAPYYGCFVRDLDGNKIEATYWDMELGKW